jgi:hypothetical protein
MSRPVRDILAESMRREALNPGLLPYSRIGDEGREEWRRRADHLTRLLDTHGLAVVRVSDGVPEQPEPTSPVILSNKLVGKETDRLIRFAGDRWQIVTVADGAETVEQAFTMTEAMLSAGLVLADDPAARAIPGLGRRLAAALEIYRLHGDTVAPAGEAA